MGIYYKLTDENSQTYGGCQWGSGITHETSGEGELCSSGWIHFYLTPELAVLLNPIHANIKNPKLWEVEAIVEKNDNNFKVGSTKVTTIRQIPLPECSLDQRIKFGILCALKVYKEEGFVNWANNWLSGKDRSYAAARAAEYAIDYTYDGSYTASYLAQAVAYIGFAGPKDDTNNDRFVHAAASAAEAAEAYYNYNTHFNLIELAKSIF